MKKKDFERKIEKKKQRVLLLDNYFETAFDSKKQNHKQKSGTKIN
jgi:hypothetical protein